MTRIEPDEQSTDAPHEAPSRLTLGAMATLGALLLGTAFVRSYNPDAFNYDVAVMLHYAERVLDGARLYVDLLDENPPLIFWLSMAPVAIARGIGTEAILVYNLLVVSLAFASAALCYRIMREAWPTSPPAHFLGWLGLLLCLELLMPGFDYGQRENLLVIGIMPYLFAASARAANRSVRTSLAATAGVLAALALALKPHFVVLWAAVECWLLFAARGRWYRIENIAIGAGIAAYIALVLLIAPEYFGVLYASMLVADAYYGADLPTLLFPPAIVFVAIGTAAGFFFRPTPADRDLRRVLTIAMLAFAVVAVLQGKGWTYHYYPAAATALFLIGVVGLGVAERSESLLRLSKDAVASAALVALVLLCAWGVRGFGYAAYHALGPGSERPSLNKVLTKLVVDKAWKKPIFAMSTSVVPGFPLVNLSGSPWGGRFSCLWFLAGFYTPEEEATKPFPYHPYEEMGELERFAIDAVIEDLERYRPQLLLVDGNPNKQYFGETDFQLVKYYQLHPRFDAIFSKYQFVATVGAYHVFERAFER